MSYKILVTDIESVLGRAIAHDLAHEHYVLISPTSDQFNWLDAHSVTDYIAAHKPDVVINTVGWQDRPNEEQQILLPSVAANVALACVSLDIPIIQFSSYQVFGADNKSSHSEKDIPSPTSPAGQAFFAAEQAVEHSLAKAIILRLGWIIASQGDNHLTRLLSNLQAGRSVQLNTRLRGAPTLLSDAARVAVALVKQVASGADNWGVMHYCSGDALNEAEFAEQLVQLLAQHQLLSQDANLSLLDFAPIEETPSAVLGCRRIRDAFGVQVRPWRPGLLPLVKQWFQYYGDSLSKEHAE